MERTLVLLKPDAVRRGLVGEIIARLERKGLQLVAMKMMRVTESLARQHYKDHVEKPFFPGLLAFITSGPIVALVVEGEDARKMVRMLVGKTSHTEAEPGTIRGDFSHSTRENLVHASDCAESADHEIALFFAEEELVGGERGRG